MGSFTVYVLVVVLMMVLLVKPVHNMGLKLKLWRFINTKFDKKYNTVVWIVCALVIQNIFQMTLTALVENVYVVSVLTGITMGLFLVMMPNRQRIIKS